MHLPPSDRTAPDAVRSSMAAVPLYLRIPTAFIILIVGSLWVWLFREVGTDAPQLYAFVIHAGLAPFGYFMLVAGLFILFPRAPFATAFLSRFRRVLFVAVAWVVLLTGAAVYLSMSAS